MGVKERRHPSGSGVYYLFLNHKGKRKSKKIGRDRAKAKELAKILEGHLAAGDLGIVLKKESTSDIDILDHTSPQQSATYTQPRQERGQAKTA